MDGKTRLTTEVYCHVCGNSLKVETNWPPVIKAKENEVVVKVWLRPCTCTQISKN